MRLRTSKPLVGSLGDVDGRIGGDHFEEPLNEPGTGYLLALRLAALATRLRVFSPGPIVAAPALTRIEGVPPYRRLQIMSKNVCPFDQ